MSLISWTDESFSPWYGCTKVSPACDHCYAENWALHYGKAAWGPHATRTRAAVSTWAKTRTWNRAAARSGTPLFVFCAHYADVFDNRAPAEWRADLWRRIAETPNLVWLLLTKRPQNFRRMLPTDWGEGWSNVWLGVTAENQREAERRLPLLCRTPAARRFVSAEPLLEDIDLRPAPVSTRLLGRKLARATASRPYSGCSNSASSHRVWPS